MLTNKALLVRLQISQWYNQTTDKAVTNEVASYHGITNSEDRYVKRLISRAAMVDINRTSAELRQFHNRNTLPWNDDSVRILATQNFFPYTEGMTERRHAFDAAVQKLIKEYPRWIEQAAREKKALFNPNDYPSADALTRSFKTEMSMMPFPNTADFRVDLELDEVERIRQEAEQSVSKLLSSANQHLLYTLRDRIVLLTAGITRSSAIFRDATFASVLDTADLVERMNITNDAAVKLAIDATRAALTNITPAILRTNAAQREMTAKRLEDILKALPL